MVKEAFFTALDNVKDKCPDFCAIYDDTPSRRRKKDLVKIVMVHLDKTGQDLDGVLRSGRKKDAPLAMLRAEFIERLQVELTCTSPGISTCNDNVLVLGYLPVMTMC